MPCCCKHKKRKKYKWKVKRGKKSDFKKLGVYREDQIITKGGLKIAPDMSSFE